MAAQVVDVAVGVGDVGAGGAAVGDVWGASGAVVVAGEAAGGLGGVEHAGHALAGEDLQVGVGEHCGGVAGVAKDAAGEAGGRGDALAVGVGGGAADVLAVLEAVVGVGEGVEAGEPFLEDEVVGESGGVAAGVAEGDAGVDVTVLDGGGDQPAWSADDEPGQVLRRRLALMAGLAGSGGIVSLRPWSQQ